MGGHVCAVVSPSLDLSPEKPITFVRAFAVILVRVGLTISETLALVQSWLEWKGFAQPPNRAMCWCGDEITLPAL